MSCVAVWGNVMIANTPILCLYSSGVLKMMLLITSTNAGVVAWLESATVYFFHAFPSSPHWLNGNVIWKSTGPHPRILDSGITCRDRVIEQKLTNSKARLVEWWLPHVILEELMCGFLQIPHGLNLVPQWIKYNKRNGRTSTS